MGSVVIINPKNDAEDTTEVSFVPMAKIKDGLSNEFSYDIKKWGEVKKGYTHFTNGDIGFAKITPCFENKKSVVFTKLKNGIGAGTTELFILRPYISSILPDFILAYVKRDAFISAGIKSFNGGVGQQRVPSEFVKNSLFPLPSTEEQARIVEKLKISIREVLFVENENNSLLKKIERTRSKLLDLAIQGKLLPQNPNDEPASVLLERIRKEQESTKTKRKSIGSYIFKGEDNLYYEQIGSETKCIQDEIPFNIPNSWAWARLGSISEVISKGTTPRGGKLVYLTKGIGFLRVENIGENFCLDMRALRYIDKDINDSVLRRSKLNHKDILISIAGTLGKIAYIPNGNQQFNANQAIAFVRLINKDITIVKYIANYLSSKIIQSIYKNMSKTTAIPNLTLEIISKTLIPFPPISEQKRIVEYISKANYQLDSMLRE